MSKENTATKTLIRKEGINDDVPNETKQVFTCQNMATVEDKGTSLVREFQSSGDLTKNNLSQIATQLISESWGIREGPLKRTAVVRWVQKGVGSPSGMMVPNNIRL